MKQITLKNIITCSGTGLHSGKKVNLTLKPAPIDSGIRFFIKKNNASKEFKVAPNLVVGTSLCTTIGLGDDTVSTIEHLMAAILGLRIDNIIIEIDGGELPIMDGSSSSYVFLFNNAGLKLQNKLKSIIRIKEVIEFAHDGKFIKAEPYNGFVVDYTIQFKHPKIGVQRFVYNAEKIDFAEEIARARTFGFLHEVEMMKKAGLALGGSLDNAIVLDEHNVLNSSGLRYSDEFVRHKILDFIGDMGVIGANLYGKFTVKCSGHAFNNEFLCFLVAHKEIYLEEYILKEVNKSFIKPHGKLSALVNAI